MTPETILLHYDQGTLWPADRATVFDLPTAHQMALNLRALREARGERVVGYKVGFTNRTIWDLYQVFAPIWGAMWNTTVAFCEGSGSIDISATALPRLEPEVVFRLGKAPPPLPSIDELFDCIDWIAPGFEVVQSHCKDWKFTAAETIADGGLHARLLVGSQVPVREFAPDATTLDSRLASAHLSLYRGEELVDRGVGSNVLGSPLQALRHFVLAFQSTPQASMLKSGDIVTTGTWTDAWSIQPGQSWHLQFDLPLESLHVALQ